MRQLRRMSDLKGRSLLASDGEIGNIEEMYFDDAAWVVRYFVVHTGSWLLGRRVLVAPRAISEVHDDSRSISVDLTRAGIEGSPPVGTERPVSRHYEAEYHRYYDWMPYWSGGSTATAGPALPPASEPLAEAGQPRLRASDEVTGYRMRLRDGELGSIEDFVVDDCDWRVRYVVASTRDWLPGRHVLVAPAWVSGIDWSRREVAVDLSGATVQSAPRYDPGQLITRDYELELYAHYGRSLSPAD